MHTQAKKLACTSGEGLGCREQCGFSDDLINSKYHLVCHSRCQGPAGAGEGGYSKMMVKHRKPKSAQPWHPKPVRPSVHYGLKIFRRHSASKLAYDMQECMDDSFLVSGPYALLR